MLISYPINYLNASHPSQCSLRLHSIYFGHVVLNCSIFFSTKHDWSYGHFRKCSLQLHGILWSQCHI